MSEFNSDNHGSINIKIIDGMFNTESFDVDQICIDKGMNINDNIYFNDCLFFKLTDSVTLQLPIDKIKDILKRVRSVTSIIDFH